MKKIIAVLALVFIVAAGVFASSTLSAGAGAYGEFKKESSFWIGPSVRYFSTSGSTFNRLVVESPMWVRNLDNIAHIEGYDIDDSDIKLFNIIDANDTFGIAFNLLGDDGLLGLTIGLGGNLSATGYFFDSDHRSFIITVGAGADVDFEIKVLKPLTVVVGASLNYPMYGLYITKNGSTTETSHESLIDKGIIMASAHVGLGINL